MRVANVEGRLALLAPGGAIDVERASRGRFAACPHRIYERWDDFSDWARRADIGAAQPLEGRPFGAPSPKPRQVFAIGLNYADHAREAGHELPAVPPTFTKFPSCITGPDTTVQLATERVDWEVEVVAVIGRTAYRVSPDTAWDHVAGLTAGQDLSARDVQLAGAAPQFSLGKSYPGFGPTGPCLASLDEFADRDRIALSCALNGETVQSADTSQLVFSIPELIARLSEVCPLLPGDLVFTGTPAGVGNRRSPPRYLRADDELISTVEGVGSLRTRFAPRPPARGHV